MHDEDDTQRLADYLGGRLSPEEAAKMARRIEEDAETAAWAKLATEIKAVEATGEASPGAFGWARLSRSIETEATQAPQTPGWRVPVWQAAAAVVLGVGLWQAAVVPSLSPDAPDGGYTTASGDPADVVRVAFVPTATEADLRALLRELDAEIVAGPSALGLYTLAARDGAGVDALVAALAARPDLVESATAP